MFCSCCRKKIKKSEKTLKLFGGVLCKNCYNLINKIDQKEEDGLIDNGQHFIIMMSIREKIRRERLLQACKENKEVKEICTKLGLLEEE